MTSRMGVLELRPYRDDTADGAEFLPAARALQPGALATSLVRWALRHEKVLVVLDIRAAAQARRLARRCDALARSGFCAGLDRGSFDPRVKEWFDIRTDVANLLTGSSPLPEKSGVVARPRTSEHLIGAHELHEGDERRESDEWSRYPIGANGTER
jgi:hypothetical protein